MPADYVEVFPSFVSSNHAKSLAALVYGEQKFLLHYLERRVGRETELVKTTKAMGKEENKYYLNLRTKICEVKLPKFTPV